MPHGDCYFWKPEIVWLHATSDAVIALSYYLIPFILIYFVRKRKDLPFNKIFMMFGVFILACGTTHLMEVWTLWYPIYRLSGIIKAITAVVSIVTAVMLVKLVPKALALPSPTQLQTANFQLENEIKERRRIEQLLHRAYDELEMRVQERTAELANANAALRNEIVERQHSQEALQSAQNEIAHVTRVTSMGELMASIAHEVNQPLAAIVTNGNACQRWLGAAIPNLEEARAAVARIISEGNRASNLIKEIRAFVKKSPPQKDLVEINDLVRETLSLVRRELARNQVALQTELAANLPALTADRVQLQQVLLNLVMNGIEAMSTIEGRSRELAITSALSQDPMGVLIAVRDSGSGLSQQSTDRLFETFFTTKADGMGMGLSISRSIVAAHGGRLWAAANVDHGATFQFTIPTAGETSV
ncbi:MAG: integral rane sensor hybrid histidine kinase [Candidatus Binatus sp.]|nr:integral rane sensor hybrid histidine kinase [Candidatus Binatus sp.]